MIFPDNEHAFGIIREAMAIHGRRFVIAPGGSFQAAIDWVQDHFDTRLRWMHPDILDREPLHADGLAIQFDHRGTHILKLDSSLHQHHDLPDFLILLLGFLLGMKLHPAGLGGLRKIPLHRGMLVEFTVADTDLVEALEAGIDFHVGASAEQRSLMYAALHWYLESLCYDHEFEMFAWQYTVLDNMHKLAEKSLRPYVAGGGHSARPVNLATFHDVPLPAIFQDADPKKAGRLAALRNEMFHEARFLGSPIGYSTSDESKAILRHLIVFNSQLMLKALGIRCDFTSHVYAGAKVPLQVRP